MDDKIVLLVEDNENDVELTLRSFERQQISNKIIVVRNGKEALDFLFGKGAYAHRDTSIAPILVLLDLNLPIIDGIEVLRQIRSHESTKLLSVVVLTSSSEDKDKIDAYGLGANSYVRKPVDFDQFLEATRQLGLYWLILNEPPPAKRLK